MAKNVHRSRHYKDPIEKHDTAAWANIAKQKPVSGVTQPNDLEVMYAKEYVDSNQK